MGCCGFTRCFGYLTEKDQETFTTVDFAIEIVSSSRPKAVIHGEGGNFSGDKPTNFQPMRHNGPAAQSSESLILR